MHADIEGAIRIAGLAAQFDWSGKIDDIEPFCAVAGWEIVHEEGMDPLIRTDLAVNRPVAYIYLRKRRMDYLSIYVTDAAAPDVIPLEVEPELRGCFTDLGRALTETLGAPTRHDTDEELRWDLSEIVIRLVRGIGSVDIDLVGRQYQAEMDEPEPEDDD
ncbi:DUF6301 family protein [Nocardia nepalensis]|uniref:DUF6301 family protein n=1 Tax=Nocardia nepalensis TaxID=3375448 RepID=UPI003B68504A